MSEQKYLSKKSGSEYYQVIHNIINILIKINQRLVLFVNFLTDLDKNSFTKLPFDSVILLLSLKH